MEISYQDEALLEGLEAADWYRERGEDLGIRFLTKWKEAEARAAALFPSFRCFDGNLRKCRFKTFPYALIFHVQGEHLHVVAVMHLNRKPGYWRTGEDEPG